MLVVFVYIQSFNTRQRQYSTDILFSEIALRPRTPGPWTPALSCYLGCSPISLNHRVMPWLAILVKNLFNSLKVKPNL